MLADLKPNLIFHSVNIRTESTILNSIYSGTRSEGQWTHEEQARVSGFERNMSGPPLVFSPQSESLSPNEKAGIMEIGVFSFAADAASGPWALPAEAPSTLTVTQAMPAAEALPAAGEVPTLATPSIDLIGLSNLGEDRSYALQRFLHPVERGDMQRDIFQTLCRPQPVRCRCGTPIAAIKARYRARARERSKARMRIILRRLQRRLNKKSTASKDY